MNKNIQLQEIKETTLNENISSEESIDKDLIIAPDTYEFYDLECKYNQYKQRIIYVPDGVTVEFLLKELKSYVLGLNICDINNMIILSNQIRWEISKNQKYKGLPKKSGGIFSAVMATTPISFETTTEESGIMIEIVERNYFLISFQGNDNWSSFGCDIYHHINNFFKNIVEKKCPKCGEPITGKGKFCSNCGVALM